MSNPSEGIPDHWKPLKDEGGNPITITWDQVQAAWRAIGIVESVRRKEGYPSMWENPGPDLAKSRLLGRILVEGKEPHLEKPPVYAGGPAWWEVPGDVDYQEIKTPENVFAATFVIDNALRAIESINGVEMDPLLANGIAQVAATALHKNGLIVDV